MGQVILSLIEYDQLKKKSDEVAQLKECFKLNKNYDGKITLRIPVEKATKIFKKLFDESEYNDGSYVLDIDSRYIDIDADIAEWYVKAIKKEESKEDEETKEDEEQ